MTNPEGEHRPVPASETEAALNREMEQNLRSAVTPERARLIGFAGSKQAAIFKSPDTPSQVTEEQIINANADDLPFAAGESVSIDRRRDYWNEGGRANIHLAEKHKMWNHRMHLVILNLYFTPEEATDNQLKKAKLARETLPKLGLFGASTIEEKEFLDNNTSQKVSLFADIETFRYMFFENKSNIKGFVQAIADLSLGADGQVDVVNLKERLDSIKPILTSFGDQSVDSLVEDYAVSYGLLTQRGRAKAVVAGETKSKLASRITQEKEVVYNTLAQKQEEIDQATTSARTEPPRPAGESIDDQEEPTGAGTRPEQSVTEPEPQIQPENKKFAKEIKEIEEELSDEVGKEIKLTPKQKEIIKNLGLPSDAFTNTYYGLQRVFEEEGEEKSHEEIMREMGKILATLTISEKNGKACIHARYVSVRGTPLEYDYLLD